MSCVYDAPERKNLVCLYMHISPDCGDESQSHAFAGKTVYAACQIASSSSTIKHACCLLLHFVGNAAAMVKMVVACDVAVHVAYAVCSMVYTQQHMQCRGRHGIPCSR